MCMLAFDSLCSMLLIVTLTSLCCTVLLYWCTLLTSCLQDPYLHNDLHLRDGPPDWPGGNEAWRAQEPVNAHSHLISMLLGKYLLFLISLHILSFSHLKDLSYRLPLFLTGYHSWELQIELNCCWKKIVFLNDNLALSVILKDGNQLKIMVIDKKGTLISLLILNKNQEQSLCAATLSEIWFQLHQIYHILCIEFKMIFSCMHTHRHTHTHTHTLTR